MTGITIKFAEEHRPIESITIDAQTASDLLAQLEVVDKWFDGEWVKTVGNLLGVLRKHRLSLPKPA